MGFLAMRRPRLAAAVTSCHPTSKLFLNKNLTLVALSVVVFCGQTAYAQSANITVLDNANGTQYSSGGPIANAASPGSAAITLQASDATGTTFESITPGQSLTQSIAGANTAFTVMNSGGITSAVVSGANTNFNSLTVSQTSSTISNGTNTSTVTQSATTYGANAAGSAVRLTGVGASLLHTNAAATQNSGAVAVDNGFASGNFATGTGRQYNGTFSAYGAGTDITQTGSFSATNNLTTGLQSDGTTGINTLFGATVSNGIANTGGLTTDTLTVSGSSTTNGITNSNAGIRNAGSISGVTALTASGLVTAGALAVTGATTTNGIANTGNIATGTLTTTGATAVGGALTVAGSTTTNGIDNSGQKITGVAAGTVSATSSDAVNGSQLSQVVNAQSAMNSNQAALNANQSVVNANQANINANQVNVNNAQTITNAQVQSQLAENRKVASAGIATATAAASIPALERDKKFGLGL